uniref:Uncharacterized protein n=1 Tax=Arundo donax TaxID=35708 RepID=A0A0A9GX61_ARUDO
MRALSTIHLVLISLTDTTWQIAWISVSESFCNLYLLSLSDLLHGSKHLIMARASLQIAKLAADSCQAEGRTC